MPASCFCHLAELRWLTNLQLEIRCLSMGTKIGDARQEPTVNSCWSHEQYKPHRSIVSNVDNNTMRAYRKRLQEFEHHADFRASALTQHSASYKHADACSLKVTLRGTDFYN